MGDRFLSEMQAEIIIQEHLLSSLAPPACLQLRDSPSLWQRERHFKIFGSQHQEEIKLLICGESSNKRIQE